MTRLKVGDVCYYMGVKHTVTAVCLERKIEDAIIINYIITPFFVSEKIADKFKIKVNDDNPFLKSSDDYANDRATKIAIKLALNSVYGKGIYDTAKKLERLKELEEAFKALSKENEKLVNDILKSNDEYRVLKNIIRTLFKGRCKLYERTEYIETADREGSHSNKIATTSYILEFRNYDLHYEFHLQKDEFDKLKEVLL